jgi:hypothetical protein
MATEVTRVLKAVTADPAVWANWVKGDECKSSKFKAAAKFELTDPVQQAVFAAYNFGTDYGTHGHKTSALYLVETQMGREPSMAGVASIAKSWFVHCVAMHRLSLKCLVDHSSELFLACDLGLTVADARLFGAHTERRVFQDYGRTRCAASLSAGPPIGSACSMPTYRE